MTTCACGALNPQGVVALNTDEAGDGNLHELMCDLCKSNWESSINFRIGWEHAKEGREGLFWSEFRNWQATQQRRAA